MIRGMKYLMSLFLGITTAFLISLYFIYKTVPPIEGELKLAGLSHEVKVYRDTYGVPHIKAKNNIDAYKALGFMQASDRLFQMEILRRVGSARLSEILGKELLQTDILLRSLRLKKTAEQILKKKYDSWPKELKQETTAFLEGVNEFVRTMPLPIEFIILGIEPEPFTLAESISVSGYMALSFAEGLLIDPLYSDLSDELPKDKLDELFIETKNDKNTILPRIETSYYKNIRKALETLEDNLGLFHGSNSWVLSGSRTKSGMPLLANDPHVAFSLPGIWYEAHIMTPTKELYGYYVPLSPYTPMGNNSDVGWTVTMAEVDDLDLFFEKIENNKVMYKNKWIPLISEKEVIKIKGEEDFIFNLKMSPHGPLLDESNMGVKNKHMAIKWSYHHPENDTVLALYKLSRAKNVDQFMEAVSHGASPGLNLSWVDSKGNIAWKIMAKIPIRPDGVSSKRVLEGWHGKHDYLGYLKPSENPGLINPTNGYIATANYAPIYSGSHPMPGYYQASERYERIVELIDSKKLWDLESMKAVQTDQHVGTWRWMIPLLIENIKDRNQVHKDALLQIRKWDGKSSKDNIAATIYHLWSVHIIKNILEDELGIERYKTFSRTADIWHFYKNLLKSPSSKWWDNTKTKKIETKEEILQLSFEQTIAFLEKTLGNKVSEWHWGKIHTLEYPHPFGKKKPLDKIFNRGPFPAGGGFFQIDNMSNARNDFNFNITLGPSVRRLIDFSKPLKALNVQPSGNSGNPISDFYDDQIDMFLNKKYRPASLDWRWIINNSKKLLLTP